MYNCIYCIYHGTCEQPLPSHVDMGFDQTRPFYVAHFKVCKSLISQANSQRPNVFLVDTQRTSWVKEEMVCFFFVMLANFNVTVTLVGIGMNK